MEKNILKSKMVRYMDAGFPIIYVNTFEEDKVDEAIKLVSFGKEVHEWSELNCHTNFETKEPLRGRALEMMLDTLKDEGIEKKIIILTINEQISKFAQSYPINSKTSSSDAPFVMN